MAALANVGRSRDKKIRLHEQAVIWFSGLRGAIALALAVEFPTAADVAGKAGEGNFCEQREHVVACTIVVVLVTVFVMGGFTKPVLNLCGIPMGVEKLKVPPRPQGAESRRRWKRALLLAERRVLRPVLVIDEEERAQLTWPLKEVSEQRQYPSRSQGSRQLASSQSASAVGTGVATSPRADDGDVHELQERL
uniref:Cation/H+ exchanger transmembrane domain-containing protein n=1 Tax=Haptolina brevifila TaxID=156173 RepID=A0A7S2DN80_9EUKA